MRVALTYIPGVGKLTTKFVNRYGLPQSGSLVIVGAIVGVGVVEGSQGVNWKQFGLQVVGWAFSTLVVGLTVAALFAQVTSSL